ncbi:MAG: Asp-tRNA(Asn)/Glu-tRNA(Gln) amidotransferase subunit GatC [Spirochaetales bacterium]|nr:Asp-tRNA(Asn)/Glu-tRNA(Gln) amidotransferase subunit GatC [Spirochaetales bacterium]
MIDKQTMRNLQKLSRLKLEPDEEQSLASQLENILSYFEVLGGYDAVDTDLKASVTPEDLRRDDSAPAFNREVLESLAVEFQDGHFVVPRILDIDDE